MNRIFPIAFAMIFLWMGCSPTKGEIQAEKSKEVISKECNFVSFVEDSCCTEIGFLEFYEGLPNLNFEEVDESFYTLTSSSKFLTNEISELKGTVSSFKNLKIQNLLKQMQCDFNEKDRFKEQLTFQTFDKNQNLIFFTHSSFAEGLIFSEMCFIDVKFEECYKIVSIGDCAVSVPIISDNRNYLAYFYSDRNISFIGMLKMQQDNNQMNKDSYISSYLIENPDLEIQEMKWKNDSTLLYKGIKNGKISYFKHEI